MKKIGLDDVLGGEIIYGMNFGFNCKAGFYASEEARCAVDEIADLGCNWVCIMTSLVQDTYASTKVYHDYIWTPEDGELEAIIGAFHARGVKVMLKIINLPLDGVWMGAINFPLTGFHTTQIEGINSDYWTKWFDSFGDGLVHYGRLLQRCGAEIFCLSGELAGAQGQTEHWQRTIKRVREVYQGLLTYEMNCGEPSEYIKLWNNDLDFVCLSTYPAAQHMEHKESMDVIIEQIGELAKQPCPSAQEMANYIRTYRLEPHRKMAAALGYPLFFAETGCRSAGGVAPVPWTIYGDVYSGEVQANYFTALIEVFSQEPWWRGMFWWKWDEQQKRPQYSRDPAGDTGYTVKGKPVFDLMRKHFKTSASAKK